MALIKCKECTKEISSDAKECPHCGKKVKKGMSCLMMIGVVMALFVFFAMVRACDTGSSSSSDVGNNSVQHKEVQEKGEALAQDAKPEPGSGGKSKEKAVKEKNAGVGDEVQIGNMAFRVNEIAFRKTIGNEMVNETADGVFMLVSISMMNTSKKSLTIDNSLFKLQDSNGAEYEFSTKGSTTLEMTGSTTLFLKQCQPNIPTNGVLIFEVPNESDYVLSLSDGMWSGSTAKINLKKK